MTLQDAIAAQPAWVGIWTMVLTVGAVVLPLLLLIWPASRVAGMVTALGAEHLVGVRCGGRAALCIGRAGRGQCPGIELIEQRKLYV